MPIHMHTVIGDVASFSTLNLRVGSIRLSSQLQLPVIDTDTRSDNVILHDSQTDHAKGYSVVILMISLRIIHSLLSRLL